MTREEAIEWLTDIKCVTENWAQEVAIDMAIEALAERPTEEEDQFKFYYVESIDDYWIGMRIDNFYYAEWDGIRFVWSHSHHLPWGEHVVDENTLWKEHTYPSEPIEIPFTKWVVGFVNKYFADRPTGKWIKSDILPHGYFCSNCDAPVMTDDIDEMLFCPNCGCEMNGGSNVDE